MTTGGYIHWVSFWSLRTLNQNHMIIISQLRGAAWWFVFSGPVTFDTNILLKVKNKVTSERVKVKPPSVQHIASDIYCPHIQTHTLDKNCSISNVMVSNTCPELTEPSTLQQGKAIKTSIDYTYKNRHHTYRTLIGLNYTQTFLAPRNYVCV